MNIVMMGVQGSGKGTQSKMLSDCLNLPHISVGDLFRHHIAQGTERGLKAKEHIDQGNLVPDRIVIDMVRDRLDVSDARSGFLLDGFPRNGIQLAALEFLRPVEHAVLLELDEDTAIARLAGRSECRKCGILYGANRKPRQKGACRQCGGPLIVRDDDKDADAVRRRLEVYQHEIGAMVAYYDWKGVLRHVDAGGDPQSVFEAVSAVIR